MKLLLLFFLFLQGLALPQPPNHSFEKRILVSQNTLNDSDNGEHLVETKKVFVTLVIKKERLKVICFPLHSPLQLLLQLVLQFSQGLHPGQVQEDLLLDGDPLCIAEHLQPHLQSQLLQYQALLIHLRMRYLV